MLAEGHLEGLELTGRREHLEYGIHGFAGAAESQTAWRCQLRALNRPDAGHKVLTSERFSQALKDGVAAVYRGIVVMSRSQPASFIRWARRNGVVRVLCTPSARVD